MSLYYSIEHTNHIVLAFFIAGVEYVLACWRSLQVFSLVYFLNVLLAESWKGF